MDSWEKLKSFINESYGSQRGSMDYATYSIYLLKHMSRALSQISLGFRPLGVFDLFSKPKFPIELYDSNGNQVFRAVSEVKWEITNFDSFDLPVLFKDSSGFWEKYERDIYGRNTYYADSLGYWERWTYKGNYQVLNENSFGDKITEPQYCPIDPNLSNSYEDLLERIKDYVLKNETDFDSRGSVAVYDMLSSVSVSRGESD